MDIATFAFLAITLFMIHEFEEIVFVRRWIKYASKNPKLSNDMWVQGQSHYPSTPAIAFMIAEEFVLASVILFVAIVFSLPELVMAVLLSHTLHLVVGHIPGAIAVRRWTPGSVTAIATLPLIGVVVAVASMTMAISWLFVVVLFVPVMALLLANLQALYRWSHKIEQCIQTIYR